MEYREDKFTSQKGDFKIEEEEPVDGQGIFEPGA